MHINLCTAGVHSSQRKRFGNCVREPSCDSVPLVLRKQCIHSALQLILTTTIAGIDALQPHEEARINQRIELWLILQASLLAELTKRSTQAE